jgi:hypothetical protein
MAKKVIDIFPPPRHAADTIDTEEIKMPLPADLPEAGFPAGGDGVFNAAVRENPKPKITFNQVFSAPDRRKDIFTNDDGPGFLKKWGWRIAVAAVAALAGMYFWDANFARAAVKIWPQTESFAREMHVLVDPAIGEVDAVRAAVPGFVISAEKTVSADSPATGTKSAQGKAQGSVKIFNDYSNVQTLIKNTRLMAPVEKFQPPLEGAESPWFLIVETVTLEPKSSAVVHVVAAAPGEKYNIEPSTFSVPGLAGTPQYAFITAQSFEKFTGGSNEIVPQVTKEDLENAKIAIQDSAKEEIKKELIAKTREQGLEIADENEIKFEIGVPEISAKAGDNAARISGQAAAKAEAIAYRKADLETLGRKFVSDQIPEGMICEESTFSVQYESAGIDEEQKLSSFDLAVSATIYAGMHPEDLKKGLSEKKSEEAKMFLMSRPGTQKAEIRLSPPWRLHVPRDLDRIDIETVFE